MQLSALRTILRGWLQDKIPAGTTEAERQCRDSALNSFLNFGLRDAQKIILAVDPEAFKCTYTADIVIPSTGVDALYAWPAGTWAVIEVATSSDGVNFSRIRRITRDQARRGMTGFIRYTKAHFMLAPSPTTAVTTGLRVINVPTLVMSEDTDECPIPPAHETLVLKCAQKLALMDIGEPTDKVEAEIESLRQEVPKFYWTATKPAFLEPNGYDGYEIE